MIYKHYERKEHLIYFLIILVGFAYLFSHSYASTSLGTSIQSDGNLLLTGASSSVYFGNNWKITPFSGVSTGMNVLDSSGAQVLIFEDN